MSRMSLKSVQPGLSHGLNFYGVKDNLFIPFQNHGRGLRLSLLKPLIVSAFPRLIRGSTIGPLVHDHKLVLGEFHSDFGNEPRDPSKKQLSQVIPPRCSFSARTTQQPSQILVEHWWNPGGSLVEASWNLTSGLPRTTPEPIWAETPKLSGWGMKLGMAFGIRLRSSASTR